jgi:methylthioribose-1-phosphate isomerase
MLSAIAFLSLTTNTYEWVAFVKFFEARSVEWRDGVVRLIDQNALPWKLRYVECRSPEEVARAIKDMTVRGAPAIGAVAAMGIALTAYHSSAKNLEELLEDVKEAARILSKARPTARNLFWALERMTNAIKRAKSLEQAKKIAVDEAIKIADEDIKVNRRLGDIGASLVEDGDTILTHCKRLG